MLTTEHRTTKREQTGEDTVHLILNQNACKKGALLPGPICSDTVSEAGYDNVSKSGSSSSSELSEGLASIYGQCVVSVASFIEGTMVFGCTGIFLPPGSSDTNATSVLTSASLVRSSDDENKIIDNLTIKVRLPDDLVVIGWLHHYDLKYDLAVVNIERLCGFCAPKLSSRLQLQFECSTNVVAVGRCFDSGMVTATRRIDIGRLSDELCELDMALLGGPLFGYHGISYRGFVGMNCREGERAVFLPRDKIIECLEHFGFRTDINQGVCGKKNQSQMRYGPIPASRWSDYPIPDNIIKRGEFYGMCVYNSFEDKFEGDIWSTFSKELRSTLSECVVALASFNEGARHFACTGVFIDSYPARILTSASLVRSSGDKRKIFDNLRIEVCLQNRARVTAVLRHCDLCYNVAVVEIICFRSPCAIELEKDIPFAPNIDVVAVGFCFRGCKLMATKGVLVDKTSRLDCKELGTSTCKITKAGIGGPLIDTCGNFVGMNFIDDEETPYLPRKNIYELLRRFDANGHNSAETIDKGDLYRWPVPEPYWDFPPYKEAALNYC
ncbi:unnamed protein product [Urochloa decumbens]